MFGIGTASAPSPSTPSTPINRSDARSIDNVVWLDARL
jgi:hypothetical protein